MVTNPLRRCGLAFAGAWAASMLGACADGSVAVLARQPGSEGGALLTPWLSLNGGWAVDPKDPLRRAPGGGQRVNFVQPCGVAARGLVLLVADAGARMLWRLDRAQDTLTALLPFTGGVPDHGASLQLGDDLSAWVALPAEHAVVQLDPRGRVVRRFRDEANAVRPVAVALPDARGEVLVGDAATAQVVVFDPLGRARRLFGSAAGNTLQSIAAMSLGPLGLYVLDRVAQQVVVFGPRAEVIELIGENQLVRPRALAVDRSGRVFVSDDVDQRIRVFRGGRLLASFGGMGPGPSRFGRIEAMAVDGNLLYVADSLNARVQVLLIAPPSMERLPAAGR